MGSRRKFRSAESSYEQTRQTAEALSFGVKTLRRGRLIPRTIMSIYCTLSVPLINPSTNAQKDDLHSGAGLFAPVAGPLFAGI